MPRGGQSGLLAIVALPRPEPDERFEYHSFLHKFFDVDASHVQVGEFLAHRSEAYKNSIHYSRKLFDSMRGSGTASRRLVLCVLHALRLSALELTALRWLS